MSNRKLPRKCQEIRKVMIALVGSKGANNMLHP